jgi:1,6-anhydro-N-acetylmuramate kinase
MSAIGIALGFAAIGELDFMAVNRGTAVKGASRAADVTQAGAGGPNVDYSATSLNRPNVNRSFPKRGTGLYDGP